MERIPDSGEAYDLVSMTTLVATSLRRIFRLNIFKAWLVRLQYYICKT
jgi:hypothetical protein